MPVQIGGPIGPFLDHVQQRQVPVDVFATCDYMAQAPNPQLDQHVQMQMLRAIRDVIGRKMHTRELTFRHLGTGDIAGAIPEIVAASGLAQNGVQVGNLAMSFGIDGHPPQPPKPQAPRGPQDDLGKGTFDLGGGAQLRVKINGMTPENYAKNEVSKMVWGWIIGAVIIGLMVVIGLGFGIYVYAQAKDSGTGGASATAAAAGKWDGKSTFECGGNDQVTLTGVTATAGVKAGGNCVLLLTGVNITAPIAIDAEGNAKVTMTGGSITASTNSVVAGANAHVDLVGTKVSGKVKASGAAKVTGAS
jgi:hypothetical protein